MPSFYGQYLDTVGIEFEGIPLDREFVTQLLAKKLPPLIGGLTSKVQVTRDASTEFYAEELKFGSSRYYASIHTEGFSNLSYNKRTGNKKTMGYEIYTFPMEIPELERIVYATIMALRNAGDFTSMRASTHFHIGYVNNLRMLKNLLAVSLYIEPVLYRLGGMGGTYRGCSNLSAYSRPLMNSVAVPVATSSRKTLGTKTQEELTLEFQIRRSPRTTAELAEIEAAKIRLRELRLRREASFLAEADKNKTRYAQIINPVSALEADTLENFWASFGISTDSENHKYHPSRYSATNFYAFPKHGTIEFRHFNQSQDSPLIVAIAKFLRASVETASKLGKSESGQFDIPDSNVEISVSDADMIIRRMVSLAYEKEVEFLPTDRDLSIIMETLENSTFEPLPKTPSRTHIKDFSLDPWFVQQGKLNLVENPLEPQNVDIHTIRYSSLYDKGATI